MQFTDGWKAEDIPLEAAMVEKGWYVSGRVAEIIGSREAGMAERENLKSYYSKVHELAVKFCFYSHRPLSLLAAIDHGLPLANYIIHRNGDVIHMERQKTQQELESDQRWHRRTFYDRLQRQGG